MRRTWFATVLVAFVFTLSLAPRVEARRERLEGLSKRRLKRLKARRRGTLAEMRAHKVKVAGRGEETIGALADRALGRHRAIQARMRAARKALMQDATIEEEAIETDDSTLLVATLTAVVVDPAALASELPELASLKRSGTNSKIQAAKLTGEAKTNFEEMKAEVRTKPAGHPLRKALEKGDQELLDALARGEGDVEVTTTVVIPKDPPPIQDGKLQVPQVDDSGFIYNAIMPLKVLPGTFEGRLATPLLLHPMVAAAAEPEPTVVTAPRKSVNETGTAKANHKFILGFTRSGAWEWEDKWSFLNADVTISAGASYGIGLRVPVRVDTEITPKRLTLKNAAKDEPGEYTVTVSAKTVDGNLDFYKDADMPVADRHDGKEFVMEAAVWFKVKGTLDLWLDKVKRTVEGGVGFDYGRNFVPPHGDCGKKCGFDFWIPSKITRTNFNVAVLKGDAQVGFWVTGDGEVSMDFEAYYGPDRIKSKHGGEEKWKHRFIYPKERSFQAKGQLTTMTMAAGVKEREKDYGYKLSAPEYEWDIDITPGLKGGLTVDLGVWDHKFNLGPWWFDWARINLGKVKLNRHKGTKAMYKELGGTKVWKKP